MWQYPQRKKMVALKFFSKGCFMFRSNLKQTQYSTFHKGFFSYSDCSDLSTYYWNSFRKTDYTNIGLEIVLGNFYLKLFNFSLALSASLILLTNHFMNQTYGFHYYTEFHPVLCFWDFCICIFQLIFLQQVLQKVKLFCMYCELPGFINAGMFSWAFIVNNEYSGFQTPHPPHHPSFSSPPPTCCNHHPALVVQVRFMPRVFIVSCITILTLDSCISY